jgi:hypothetical protein
MRLEADLTDRAFLEPTLYPFVVRYDYDPDAPQTGKLEFRARLYTPVSLSTIACEWSPEPLSLLSKSTRTISITPVEPVKDILATSDASKLAVSCEVADDGKWIIHAQPSTELNKGPFQDILNISVVLRDGRAVGPIRIPAKGYVLNEYYAVPHTLSPAIRLIGEPARLRFAVKSSIANNLEVKDLRVNDETITVPTWSTDVREEFTQCTIDVVASSNGEHRFTLKVIGEDPNRREFEIDIPVTFLSSARYASR